MTTAGRRRRRRALSDRRLRVGSTTSRTGGEIDAAPETQLTRQPTLSEHLKAQLRANEPDRRVRTVACDLVDWLDEDGYLREADDVLASHLGMPVTLIAASTIGSPALRSRRHRWP